MSDQVTRRYSVPPHREPVRLLVQSFDERDNVALLSNGRVLAKRFHTLHDQFGVFDRQAWGQATDDTILFVYDGEMIEP